MLKCTGTFKQKSRSPPDLLFFPALSTSLSWPLLHSFSFSLRSLKWKKWNTKQTKRSENDVEKKTEKILVASEIVSALQSNTNDVRYQYLARLNEFSTKPNCIQRAVFSHCCCCFGYACNKGTIRMWECVSVAWVRFSYRCVSWQHKWVGCKALYSRLIAVDGFSQIGNVRRS